MTDTLEILADWQERIVCQIYGTDAKSRASAALASIMDAFIEPDRATVRRILADRRDDPRLFFGEASQ